MRPRILLLITIVASALVSPAQLEAWKWEDRALKPVPLPQDLRVVTLEIPADFDSDGVAETLTLAGGRLTIQTDGQTRWQSPQAWQVRQAQIGDLNRDGIPEAALLVWRPFKPWPVDIWLPNGGRIKNFHDSDGKSCHIILIGWTQGAFRELWAGSAMANPVERFVVADLAGNGRQYLVTLVGDYDDPPSAPSRALKVWEWNGFGFTVVHELDDSFNLMVAIQTEDGRTLLLAH